MLPGPWSNSYDKRDNFRAVGVGIFEADVLVENSTMIRVFEKSGLAMTKDYEGRSVHITMTL
jgi:hypothetical protein